MSKRPLRLGLFFAFCIAIVTAWVIRAGGQQPQTYVPNEVIVKLVPGTPAADVSAVRSSLNAVVKRQFESIGAELWRINGVSVMDAITRLQGDPRVLYIEPNFVVRAVDVFPNDPRFDDLWGMHNTGQTGGTPDADIDAPEAWGLATNSDVLVGVIDTGVDYNHVDLSTNIFVNPGEIAANGVDDDGNGFIDDVRGWDFVNNDNNPMDDNGHGTHCSGTIGAIGNNGTGVVGVSWTVKIMPLKFLDAGGFGNTGDAIEAVEYATMMGCKLTSNSWGGGGFSQALLDAIEAAGDAGYLFIAAAGNGSSNNDLFDFFPATYPAENIIAVASTDHNDNLSGFSNFGLTTVDLGAPGSNILSTFPGNTYGTISGTSMATPHVSGAICLLWAAAPEFTHMEVKQTVMESVDVIPALQGRTVSGGRLNIFNIINGLDDVVPDPVNDLAVEATGSSHAILSWTASGDDGAVGTASSYDLRYSTSPIDAGNFDLATSAGPLPHPQIAGTHETFEVGGLDFSTQYYFALVVVDEQQNRSGISNVPDGTTLGAPDIEYAPASFTENLLTGGSASQTLTIQNVAAGTLDFSFAALPAWLTPNPASGRINAGASMDVSLNFDATGLFGGVYNQNIQLNSNDPNLASASIPVTLNVTGAPDIASDPTEWDYGIHYFNYCESKDIVIRNIGAEVLTVNYVGTFNTEFTVDGTPFTLIPGQQRTLTVNFCPVDEGTLPTIPKRNPRRPDATLTLETNDPDHPTFKVPLFGEGVQPPVIQVDPLSLSADLFTGGSDTQPLHIENLGDTPLDFALSISDVAGPNATINVLKAPAANVDRDKDITPAGSRTAQKGSPYATRSAIKREQPESTNKPVITSASAMEILLLHTGDVNELQGDLLGFPDVALVHTFDASANTPTLETLSEYDGVILIANFPFGDKDALGDVLADYVDQGGGVVQTLATFIDPWNVGGRFLAEGYSAFTLGSGPVGFSNLGNFDATHPIMAGVSNASGDLLGATTLTPGAQWVADWQIGQPFIATQGDHVVGANVFVADGGFYFGDVALVLHNSVLWSIGAAWLSADPTEGTLPPGASIDVAVTFDATGLNGGDYSANLNVASNDPATPVVVVPASLHVTGAPDINVPTDPLAYGEVFINGSSSKTIEVSNAGTDLLTVSSIATNHGDYSVDVSNVALNPGESQDVVVTFAPTATGPTNATLTLTSDDPDEGVIQIALSGTGVMPPIITVNPTSLEDSLYTGETSGHTVTIGNIGASNLTFAIDTEEVEGAAAPIIKQKISIPRSDGTFPRGTQAASARMAPGAHAKASNIKMVPGATAVGSAFATEASFGQATRFTLSNPEVLNFIGSAPDFIWAGDFGSGDDSFAYAVNDLNQFMQIDTTTGAQTILGTIVPFGGEIWTGMAFDPTDGSMYATGTDIFSSSLYSIDVANATSTRIGSINMPGIIACAIDSDGNMYAHDLVTDELVSIDKTTGMGTPIGSLGFDANFGQGMGFDGETGILYLAAFNNFEFRAELRIADTTTGNTALVGVLGADVPGGLVQLGWLAVPGLGGVQWLSADPTEGIVPPGTSMDIAVTFDAAGLFGGDYNANLLINNNDPVNPVVPVAAHLHVTGAPDIAVDQAPLDYGNVFIGGHSDKTVKIKNAGTDVLTVTSIATDHGDYSVNIPNLVLAPATSQDVVVSFSPTSTGPSSATLTIASDDPDEPSLTISLSGVGLLPPIIGVNPTSFSADLFTGESDTQTMTISNTGASDLVFAIDTEEVTAASSASRTMLLRGKPWLDKAARKGGGTRTGEGNSRDPHTETPTSPRTPSATANDPAILVIQDSDAWGVDMATFIFDMFGISCTVINSGAIPGTNFNDFDLVLTVGDEGFNYYNALSSNVAKFEAYVASGGVVQYQLATQGDPVTCVGGVQVNVGPFENFNDIVDASHPIVAGLSSPLEGNSANHTTISNLPAGANVITETTQSGDPTTVEYEHGSGAVVLTGMTWEFLWNFGFEAGAMLGNAVAYSLTLAGVQWLEVTPSEGTVPAGGSMDVSVTFDATGLFGGDYAANILVGSNDPLTPVVTATASLHVTGAPDIAVPTDPLHYGPVFVGGTATKTLVVTNDGTDLLTVSSIVSSHADFTVDVASFNLAPTASQNVVVTYSPTTVAVHSGTLTINSDDPDESVIVINYDGEGLEPPIISVNPTSLDEDLVTGETADHTVTIGNSGGSNLEFSIRTEEVDAVQSITKKISIAKSNGDFPKGSAPPSARMAPGTHAKASSIKMAPGATAVGSAFATEAAFAQATRFSLTNPEVLNFIGSAPDFIWAGDFASGDNSFAYAVNDLNQFMQIDTTTGAQSILGTIVPFGFEIWTGMAFDPTDGTMYATGTDIFSSSLYVIDVENATSTRIGPINMPGIIACAIDNDGNMYAHDLVTDELVSIDKTTGNGTPIGFLGFDANFGQGMGYDGETETLYLAAFNNFTFQAELRIADTTTGNTALVGVLGSAVPGGLVQLGWLAIPGLGGVQWLSADPTEGIVPPGTSMDVTVTFDATGMFGGDYNANLLVENNDPLNPVVPVAAHLHVTGAPDIAVTPSILNFGLLFVNGSATQQITIKNQGTDLLTISAITTGHPDYSTNFAGAALAPGQSHVVDVTYAPTSPGDNITTLSVVSDDPDEPSVSVDLQGEAVMPPIVGVSPTAFSDDLFTGEIGMHPMLISNTGASDLVFTIDTEEVGGSSASRTMLLRGKPWLDRASLRGGGLTGGGTPNSRDDHTSTPISPKSPGFAVDGPAVLVIQNTDAWGVDMSTFIFDNFGISCTVINSGDIAGTDFDDFDLVLTVGDEDFNYYNALSANVAKFEAYVAGGGVVQYQLATQGDPVTCVGGVQVQVGPFENFNDIVDASHPIVAGLSSPLEGNSANHTTLHNLPGGTNIITETTASGDPTTVEYAHGSGTVVLTGMTWEFLYNFGFPAGAMLGNAVAYSLSLAGVQWLEIIPSEGTVPPGGNVGVLVRFDATGLNGGDYAANILVNSNDPVTPQVVATANLHVTGATDIEVPTTPLSYGQVFLGGSSSQVIVVSNPGTDVLMVSSISSSHPAFTVDIASFNLAPETSQNVTVTFGPVAVGAVSGNLTINSNDPDEGSIVIAMDGEGLLPPVISVTPLAITDNLNEGESAVHEVTIDNSTGGSSLNWSISSQFSANSSTIVATSPIMGDGKVVDTVKDPKKPMSPNSPKASDVFRFASSGQKPTAAESGTSLEVILANLNLNYGAVTSLIPNRFDFFEGDTGNNIIDGGNDMYDGGNFLGTNLGSSFNYSDNVIVSHGAFGPEGRYFTRKFPGLFVLVADMSNVDYFETFGNVGADGGGNVDGAILDAEVSGISFRGFVKRIYNAFDPSVNHIMLVEENPGASHEFAMNTDDDYHRMTGLSGSTRIYYILYASQNGGYVDNTATLAIMESFLNALGLSPAWISMTPTSGSVPAGQSAIVDVTLDATGLSAGPYSANLVIDSNDPVHPEVSVLVELTVDNSITDIGDDRAPTKFELYANRPNPFNPTTTIAYDLPRGVQVTLTIYDVNGREVRQLVNASQPAGQHQVMWDGRNSASTPVASGVYFYKLAAGEFVQTKKMVLLK